MPSVSAPPCFPSSLSLSALRHLVEAIRCKLLSNLYRVTQRQLDAVLECASYSITHIARRRRRLPLSLRSHFQSRQSDSDLGRLV
jgi:hypothetical protein